MTPTPGHPDRPLPQPDYERGGVRLYQGDCRSILPGFPDGSFDGVVTDPPYGVRYERMNGAGGRGERSAVVVDWDAIDGDGDIDPAWLSHIYKAVRNGGACYFHTRWDVEPEWRRRAGEAGWLVKQRLIWHHAAHGKGDLRGTFAPDYEDLLFCTKGRHILTCRPPAVIQVTRVPTWEIRHHPHQKPIDLPMRLIRASGFSFVCDPFTGSGTTGVACAKLGVAFVGIEKSPEYFDIACQRIERAFEDQALFEGVADE